MATQAFGQQIVVFLLNNAKLIEKCKFLWKKNDQKQLRISFSFREKESLKLIYCHAKLVD